MAKDKVIFKQLHQKGAALAPSVWMYSASYPNELFAVEGKWARALMHVGFRQLTISKVSRNFNLLWDKSHFVNREELRDALNQWLHHEGHELVISKMRLKYMFAGDERSEINDLIVRAMAAVFNVELRMLFSRRAPAKDTGLFRCVVIVAEQIFHRVYVASSNEAATQRCLLDLLVGETKVTTSPNDWYKASIECVELASWNGAISIEELTIWLGHIGMKFVDRRNANLISPTKDEQS
jgi:hypothetical protein